MFTVIGFVVVIVGVVGGYLMAHGPLHVLWQPAELVIIGGAALGALIVSAPSGVLGMVGKGMGKAFTPSSPTKAEFLDLLKLQYEVYQFMRKNGAVALDEHVQDFEKSSIFSKYPTFLKRHHAVEFFRDALKQVVNGTAGAEELDMLLDTELETHHEEAAIPVGVIQKVGDAMPALGIVAAVLGIIITMGSLDKGPEEIGHKVGAALVGTFLGVLCSYGIFGPLATNLELQEQASGKYLACIKEGLVSSQRGASPVVAIEFARKVIFSGSRPSGDDLDGAVRSLKGG